MVKSVISGGRVSFTQPSQKQSFCIAPRCCNRIASQLNYLIQATYTQAPTTFTVQCSTGTLTEVLPRTSALDRTWEADISWTDCLLPDPFTFQFRCNEDAPVSDGDCKQRLSFSLNGNAVSEDSCCCFNTFVAGGPDEIVGQDRGFACLVGGLSPLWAGGLPPLPTTGCNINQIPAGATENEISFTVVWVWQPDTEQRACCHPNCDIVDALCPSNPCSTGSLSAMHLTRHELRRLGELW